VARPPLKTSCQDNARQSYRETPRKPDKDEGHEGEFAGNIPVGDKFNLRGIPVIGSRVSNAVRFTRPEREIIAQHGEWSGNK